MVKIVELEQDATSWKSSAGIGLAGSDLPRKRPKKKKSNADLAGMGGMNTGGDEKEAAEREAAAPVADTGADTGAELASKPGFAERVTMSVLNIIVMGVFTAAFYFIALILFKPEAMAEWGFPQ